MENIMYAVPAFGVLALLYTYLKSNWVSSQAAGNDRMVEISTYIANGAMAFLKAEYKVLSYFVVIACILLGILGSTNHKSSPVIVIAFIIGAVFSALAGFIGMRIATKANVRTAEAARTSLSKALDVSFTGGTVMGMGVAGLAVLGLGSLFIVFKAMFVSGTNVNGEEMEKALEVLTGFSLGAESISWYSRRRPS
jgi:K(+)-stimulated pyrophosphate-energized sodium pump